MCLSRTYAVLYTLVILISWGQLAMHVPQVNHFAKDVLTIANRALVATWEALPSTLQTIISPLLPPASCVRDLVHQYDVLGIAEQLFPHLFVTINDDILKGCTSNLTNETVSGQVEQYIRWMCPDRGRRRRQASGNTCRNGGTPVGSGPCRTCVVKRSPLIVTNVNGSSSMVRLVQLNWAREKQGRYQVLFYGECEEKTGDCLQQTTYANVLATDDNINHVADLLRTNHYFTRIRVKSHCTQ